MPAQARGHEVIEHTADLGLRVWAPTLDELFAEAAVALVSVMGSARSGAALRVSVALDAGDLEALFVDWLSEVLYLFETQELVPVEPRVRVREDACRLEGVIVGVSAQGFEQAGPAVKAVTYHEVRITRSDEGYEAQVFVDV